jgi:hypothetical protein
MTSMIGLEILDMLYLNYEILDELVKDQRIDWLEYLPVEYAKEVIYKFPMVGVFFETY